jgi:uncharacterized membrane protein YebE (DUF533 family)
MGKWKEFGVVALILLGLLLCMKPARSAIPWWQDCAQLSAFAYLAYNAAWHWDVPEDKFVLAEDLDAPEDYQMRLQIKHEAYHAPMELRKRLTVTCAEKSPA